MNPKRETAVERRTRVELPTSRGPARVHLDLLPAPRAALVLGHGAGGGVEAPDLRAATGAALAAGVAVARVEQPYRVAGRRVPDRAPVLDAAWREVVAHLAGGEFAGLPLLCGGRSSGARVACRTAADTGACGVLCLAFPLRPPPRRGGAPDGARREPPSRLPELASVTVPVLVVQGERDPFGMPPDAPGRTVTVVPGDHSLRSAAPVAAAVADWLARVAAEG